MNKRKTVAAAMLGTMALSLGWPMPSQAEEEESEASPFAGYTAYAQAGLARIKVYEDSLPIPTVPQLDFNVLYSRADGSTGPSNRSNASVLWPGDTLGDGLGTLAGNESIDYPVKVKSKFPETSDAPQQNSIVLYEGSGMTTTANAKGSSSTSSAIDFNGGGDGTVKGICGILALPCPVDPTAGIQLPAKLAGAIGAESVKSSSRVVVGDTVKSVADVKAAGISILQGLITLDGIQSHSEVDSDGVDAKPTGFARIAGLSIAGQKIDLGQKVDLAGQGAAIPKLPNPLEKQGVSIEGFVSQNAKEAAEGTFNVQGMKVVVDMKGLSKALTLGGIGDPLTPVLDQIPQLGVLLVGLLKFGTKLEISLGDVEAMATASPTFVPDLSSGGESTTDENPASGAAGGSSGGAGGDTSGSGGSGGSGDITDASGGSSGLGTETTLPPGVTPELVVDGTAPAGDFTLPGLGKVPTLLLLAALALAGLYGWLFKTLGGFIVGGGGTCLFGLNTGVPDLRKG